MKPTVIDSIDLNNYPEEEFENASPATKRILERYNVKITPTPVPEMFGGKKTESKKTNIDDQTGAKIVSPPTKIRNTKY